MGTRCRAWGGGGSVTGRSRKEGEGGERMRVGGTEDIGVNDKEKMVGVLAVKGPGE